MGAHEIQRLAKGLRGYGIKPDDAAHTERLVRAAQEIGDELDADAALEEAVGSDSLADGLRRSAASVRNRGVRAQQVQYLRDQGYK